MSTVDGTGSMIRRYLLGDLSDEETGRFEDTYFSSDDRFAEMIAAEDDLIDEFLHQEMGAADRQRFEARFLSSERGRQKVGLASALVNAPLVNAPAAKAIGSPGPSFRLLAVAAAIIVLAFGAVMLRQLSILRQQLDHQERERVVLRGALAATTAEVQRLNARTSRPPVFSMILAAAERGSRSSATLILSTEPATAELWLILPRDSYPSYTATLQSIDGRPLWSEHGLTAHNLDGRKAILFRVPSTSLSPRTYIVNASGEEPGGTVESVEEFSFSVRRP